MSGRFNAYTGKPVVDGVEEGVFVAAELGLEAPRYCVHCGRRMIVQISPDGWWSKCSRHGVITSSDLEQQR